jgi:4-hydroxyphenylpyruvate dioxygenase-like putative hemolysin
MALKKLVGEWEEKYAQLKQLYYTKFATKASRTDQHIQTDTTMADLVQNEVSANELSTKYKYIRKLCEWRKDEITALEKRLTQAGIAQK